jgi:predicted nucleic acid-binding Zn ribbon protein
MRKAITKVHYSQELTDLQKQFIYGSLLGDLCVRKPKGKVRNAYMTVSHCLEQAEYVQFKYLLMKNFVRKPPKAVQNKGWGTRIVRFNTLSHPAFTEIYDICYPKGRKAVSLSWLSQVDSPLALAIWYMDDGSLGKEAKMRISTYGFGKEGNHILQDWLKNRWHVNSRIVQDIRGRGFYLAFLAKDRDRFFSLVRQYIIPSMRYKILPELKTVPCVICSKPVLPKRAIISAGKKVVCSSPECKLALAKLNRGWKPKKPRPCEVCGQVFTPIQEKTKTCSLRCKRIRKLQWKREYRLRKKLSMI